MTNAPTFHARRSVEQVEEGTQLAPKFDQGGLIPAIVTDFASGEVLMLGYMNEEALRRTLETGLAHYWSRSRQKLWRKGEQSGLVQKIADMRIDDDQDALWLRVHLGATQDGAQASCHVGYRSCFYRSIKTQDGQTQLIFEEDAKTFDPEKIYGHIPSPTKI